MLQPAQSAAPLSLTQMKVVGVEPRRLPVLTVNHQMIRTEAHCGILKTLARKLELNYWP
jgi:hypothetical protein